MKPYLRGIQVLVALATLAAAILTMHYPLKHWVPAQSGLVVRQVNNEGTLAVIIVEVALGLGLFVGLGVACRRGKGTPR